MDTFNFVKYKENFEMPMYQMIFVVTCSEASPWYNMVLTFRSLLIYFFLEMDFSYKKWKERGSDEKIIAELNHSLEIHGRSPCGTPRVCHSTNLPNFFKAKYRVSYKTIWILSKVLWLKHDVDSRPHTVPEKKWLINAQRNLFLAFQLLL